jgi:hypothetical protein
LEGKLEDVEAKLSWEAHEGVLWWWGGHFMGAWLCVCVVVESFVVEWRRIVESWSIDGDCCRWGSGLEISFPDVEVV